MLEASLEVTVAEEVRFALTVVNAGDTPMELTFRDACRADFVVYDDGEEVWRFSEGLAFSQVLTTADLQPGESAVFEEAWPDPEPGEYTAEATLRVRETDVSARAPFTV